jgi:DNA helicase-2/ATP-dependent DNA helicase PcrA
MSIKLTEEQLEIVNHLDGPALVFAVAGAGKTTAMVNRIAQLLRLNKTKPEKILATTYSKEGTKDLEAECAKLGIPNTVYIRTLHSIAFGLIKRAQKMNLISDQWRANTDEDIDTVLINKSLSRIAKEENKFKSDLNIDNDELRERIGFWKANLFYPELDNLTLPENILKEVRPAEDINPLLVKAYKYYEEERRKNDWITFDDMLVMGWECLMRSEALLTTFQNAIDYVLVDEFQDVNLVQYKILDLITKKKKNYMVIGDDDQCIYEWRGASNKFILNFEKEYSAKTFRMTDNFRCKASTLALANNLIKNNKNRYSKRLQLTQGFNGDVRHITSDGSIQMSEAIFEEIKRQLNEGAKVSDIVVLIREYAQTPFLENIFIKNNFPYQIVGNKPFYKRQDAIVLFYYIRWFLIEIEIKKGFYPKNKTEIFNYLKYFKEIINKPNRFLSASVVEEVCNFSMANKKSVIDGLIIKTEQVKKGTAENVQKFIQLYDVLDSMKASPAKIVFQEIEKQTEYKKYIIEKNHLPELGELKARIVDAIIDFADGKGNMREFLNYLDKITFNNIEGDPDPKWFKIMTIFKAKGLEWDNVIIPDCNDGTIPLIRNNSFMSLFGSSFSTEYINKIEEERRLFYVALTRSRKNLFLFTDKTRSLSTFISECDPNNTVIEIKSIVQFLDNIISDSNVNEIASFMKDVRKHQLHRFFEKWCILPTDKKARLKEKISSLEQVVLNKTKEVENNKQIMQDYDREVKDFNVQYEKFYELNKPSPDLHLEKRIQVLLNPEFIGKDHFAQNEFSFIDINNGHIPVVVYNSIIGKVFVSKNEKVEDFIFIVGRTARYLSISKTGKSIYVLLNKKINKIPEFNIPKPVRPILNESYKSDYFEPSLLDDIKFFKSVL